jgi:DNA-binding NarL/FixJ family response regulator
MQETVQTGGGSPVWIVGQHPLAAKYLRETLTQNSRIQAHWIQAKMPSKQELGNCPLFILDNAGLEISISLCVRNLNELLGPIKYIVLDGQLQHHNIYEWLSVGIHGFLTYEQVPQSLPSAIQSVTNGSMWVDARILQKFMRLNKRERQYRSCDRGQYLTLQEEQIFHLAGQRFSNREIASKLKIKVSTVKFHLTNIFSKLQIKGKPDLWQESASPQITDNLIRMNQSHPKEQAS